MPSALCVRWEAEGAAESEARRRMRRPAWQHMIDLHRGQAGNQTHLQAVSVHQSGGYGGPVGEGVVTTFPME